MFDTYLPFLIIVRLILVVTAANAVSERSASTPGPLPLEGSRHTYLRTAMSQEILNHCMILHVHKEMAGHGRYWKSACFSIK